MLESWPLVGRREELEFITDALEKGVGGVVLAGAPGVGKTRLAQETLSRSEASSFPVYWTVATRSASSIPFGALANLLPVPSAGGDQLDLLRHATDALASRGQGRRVVLGVDDAHLLDDASAAFVLQASVSGLAFVVATIRTGESVPDSIVALWKDGIAQRVEVQTLAEHEVQELMVSALGGVVSRATAYDLNVASRGNPLLLRELLMSGLESGALVRKGGIWTWTGPFAGSVRLREMIEARLGTLDTSERRVLELVAFGEPIGLETLENLADHSAIESVDQKELLNLSRDDKRLEVRVAHPLYGEVIRSSTPATRARSHKKQLARALEGFGARRADDVLRTATWQLEADSERNAELLIRAASHAMNSLDYGTAERLASAAMEAGGGFEASYILADALRSLAKSAQAEQLLNQMIAGAKDDAQLRKVSEVRAYNLFFGLDRPSEAKQVLSDARTKVHSREEQAKLWGQESLIALYSGRPVDAMTAAERVWDNHQAPPSAIVDSILGGATAFAMVGETEKALETYDRERSVAAYLQTAPGLQGQLLSVRFLILWLAGSLYEAETLADNVHAVALIRRSHDGMALMSAAQGQAALARGKPKTAVSRFREAVALLRERDRNRFLPWALGGLGHASALVGDEVGAAIALKEAEEDCPRGVQIFAVEFTLSKAWVAAIRGEISMALELAGQAARTAAISQQHSMEAIALHAAARMGNPQGSVARLTELSGLVSSEYVAAYADHVTALVQKDPVALDRAAARFEEMGAILLATEAATEEARIHRAAGRNASALGAEERAASLRAQCEGARTPALLRGIEPIPLTKREREIISLAAQGLSSKQIADKLVVSIRTVDNHLHHAYSKLGISKREELATLSSVLKPE
ncbi:MAG: LuxR C-terminal-related transcriptional regulator [Actinobacteria bacterium]|nr:LuxR C-terminal-related transcriptional regulator [Actinomycetota bacterium]